jgi:hypothetical protein
LPERPIETEAPTAPARSPFATTQTVESWWPTTVKSQTVPAPEPMPEPTPAPEPVASAEPEASDETAQTQWPTYGGYAPGSGFSWQTATAPEPTDETPAVAEESSNDSEPAADLTQPIVWSGAETAPEDPISEQEAVQEEEDTVEAKEAATESVLPAEESGAGPAAESEDEPEAEPDPEQTAAAIPLGGGEGEPATLADAISQVERLRETLTRLESAGVSQTDDSDLKAHLTETINAQTIDQGKLDALMDVVNTAQSRPRDIDVLLDLTRHLDTIVQLKSSYDGLRGALSGK